MLVIDSMGGRRWKTERDRAYIAKLAKSELSKSSYNLPANFVGDVELHHAHLGRAKRRILLRSHGDDGCGGASDSSWGWGVVDG